MRKKFITRKYKGNVTMNGVFYGKYCIKSMRKLENLNEMNAFLGYCK